MLYDSLHLIFKQRQIKGDENFTRDWQSYKDGFGTLENDGDFWLGNEAVHTLTNLVIIFAVELVIFAVEQQQQKKQ